ncbi:hypothetical protein L2E82_25401 [Cichorium intybus]|uniref:Uncharacterized protein n=1 Tax=Cichorium intybus TaxID=13427 RepID=A0ACB9E3T9_CICIN|nr:hypothetical protein L2E82_25401 [Cichorium intybus]
MNRRIRRRSATADGYLRYLKPGALAQLRDSKIIAKTHHRSAISQIYIHRATSLSPVASPSRSPNVAGVAQQQQEEATGTIAATDGGSPCFSVRFYGPRCPQRKKLMAARSMFFLDPNPISPTSDGPEPVIDAFPNDFLVAH